MTDQNKPKGKRKIARWRIVVASILLVVAIVLIFSGPIRNTIIQWNMSRYGLDKHSAEELANNRKGKFDYEDVSTLSLDKLIEAQMQAQKLKTIGGVAVPDVGINLPIFRGVTNASLSFGAGTMTANQEMGEGNYALISHHLFDFAGSSSLLFSPLENAKEGMKIYLTDKNQIYVYTITDIRRVDPTKGYDYAINPVDGQKLVTLITCTDRNATQRIVVRGSLEKTIAYNKAPKAILKYFSREYNQQWR